MTGIEWLVLLAVVYVFYVRPANNETRQREYERWYQRELARRDDRREGR